MCMVILGFVCEFRTLTHNRELEFKFEITFVSHTHNGQTTVRWCCTCPSIVRSTFTSSCPTRPAVVPAHPAVHGVLSAVVRQVHLPRPVPIQRTLCEKSCHRCSATIVTTIIITTIFKNIAAIRSNWLKHHSDEEKSQEQRSLPA